MSILSGVLSPITSSVVSSLFGYGGVVPRWWLKFAASGYFSYSSSIVLATDYFVSADLYLPTTGASYMTIASGGTNYIRIYDSNHATYPNAVELRTSVWIYRWLAAFPSDRTKSYNLKLDVVSNEASVLVDGVETGAAQTIAGTLTTSESFFAAAGDTAGNLNFNNEHIFLMNEGSSTPADSVGSITTTFVGAGQTWVFGTLPENAVVP